MIDMKNKKTSIAICFLLFSLIALIYMSNRKLSTALFWGVYYYINNDELLQDEDFSMKVPYYYIREKKKDGWTLLRFPNRDKLTSIFVYKNKVLNKTIIDQYISLIKGNYYLHSYKDITVEKNKGVIIEEYSRIDPVYCQVQIMVPKRAIWISYIGEKEYADELKEMVETIIFKEAGG